MKRVLLTEFAANRVLQIQEDHLQIFSYEKSVIADSLGVLSTLLCLARDCEEIQNNTDDILNVMEVLNRYNSLLNCLNEKTEKEFGKYEYVSPKQDYDEDCDSPIPDADSIEKGEGYEC